MTRKLRKTSQNHDIDLLAILYFQHHNIGGGVYVKDFLIFRYKCDDLCQVHAYPMCSRQKVRKYIKQFIIMKLQIKLKLKM